MKDWTLLLGLLSWMLLGLLSWMLLEQVIMTGTYATMPNASAQHSISVSSWSESSMGSSGGDEIS
jgi:hypothetical protein